MAIINYLFAKKAGGTIVFRSEDTDRERSMREYEEDIKEQLAWLGISWDEFYRTSELLERHKAAMARLIAEDKAYVSKEESKREPGVEVEVVRLRNPGKTLTFSDVVRGDITFDTAELGNFAIGRAIDDPLYHLAVVVDDADMGITHIIRGEDHISNTPRQILIQEALGYERPVYAHYPLLLGSDRAKLSKRTGDVAVKSYREQGYLPEALLNYIAMLGWTPPSEREIMPLDEMIAEFALEDLHKSGAIFDMEKLRWYNKEYMRTQSDEVFATEALPRLKAAVGARGGSWDERAAARMMPLLRERIEVWGDVAAQAAEGEYDFFFIEPAPAKSDIPQKGSDAATAARHLAHVHELFEAAGEESFADAERLKNIVWDYASSEGRGEVLWPLRFSLSGRAKSPDPFTIAFALGRERTLARIAAARTSLEV
jgi:glutamyl-tRNA synthetase